MVSQIFKERPNMQSSVRRKPMGSPILSRFKPLLRVGTKELKACVAFAKRARIRRATARRLEWAIERASEEPLIDLNTPS